MEHTKTDIRRVMYLLIHYFKAQEEIPVQEEKDELLARIRSGIRQKRRKGRKYHLYLFAVSAAVFIGVVCLGIEKYMQDSTQDISLIASKMLENVNGKKEIQLIISQDEVISIEENAEVVNTETGAITVNQKKVTDVSAEEDLYSQIIVPKGKHTRLILADGSKLYVNADTKVIYPRVFKKDKREIYVDGEIFIDVKPDETTPFFVKTFNFEVRVLGTAFNVNAYKVDNNAEVTLLRGSVQLKDSKDQVVMLAPDQQAEIRDGLLSGKREVNAEEYVLWTKGVLSLHDEDLKVILGKLSRYYGVDINCSENISKVKIAGKIDLECGIDEALKRISVTGRFSFLKQGNSYMLKPLENNIVQ